MYKNKQRFIWMILVGVLISFLLHGLIPQKSQTNWTFFLSTLESVMITFFIWEGNLNLDFWLNKQFPWEKNPMKRIFVQLPASFLYSGTILYVTMWLYNQFVCRLPESEQSKFFAISVTIGLLVSVVLLSVETGAQFFRQWKKTLIEVEKYKSESAQAQLENLKNQVNPHFLFNNMSVLSSLVYKDQDKAVDFINQLSKVYRYLLDNKTSELVTLKEELTFIESYIYLLDIRYSPNLHFKVQIPEDKLNLYLPPMSVQLLIENAIKHNEISSDFPLTVEIYINNDNLFVVNNLQKRIDAENSSNTGLKNIQSRYAFFTEKEVIIEQTERQFKVSIPILTIS
jgi:two-component system LytT family sensor kinase